MFKYLWLTFSIFNIGMLLVLSSVVLLWHLQVGVEVDFSLLCILLTSVWLGYQADHWMDAAKSHQSLWCPQRLRLLWAARYPFLVLWLAVLVYNVWHAFDVLEEGMITFGLILMSVAILYVFSVQLASALWKQFLSKEWFVSTLLLFAIVLFLPKVDWVDYGSLLSVFLLFWLNCKLISRHEAALDHKLSMPSLIHRPTTRKWLWLIVWIVSIGISISLKRYWMGAAACMSGLLLFLGKELPFLSYRSSIDFYIWFPFLVSSFLCYLV